MDVQQPRPQISIAGRAIGAGASPYIIAELSANHNGDIMRAKRLMQAAHNAGADAVKLQTYRPDTITLDSDLPDFQITDGLWAGRNLFDLYGEAHTPWEWHKPLFDYARELGLVVFSSPFDHTAVDLLERLHTPAYKIASFELIDLPLIRYAARTGKPLLMSCGMSDEEEIAEALGTAREAGAKEIALLHCVSGYPAPAAEYRLRTLPNMVERFGVVVGLSDHTIDNTTAIASIALGAAIVEKHFTLDRQGGGPDDSFSLEPDDLAALCRDAKTAHAALGKVDYSRSESEKGNVKFRRSLYFVRDVPEGAIVGEDDVRSVRPGFGLKPKYREQVVGRRARRAITAPKAVRWEDVER